MPKEKPTKKKETSADCVAVAVLGKRGDQLNKALDTSRRPQTRASTKQKGNSKAQELVGQSVKHRKKGVVEGRVNAPRRVSSRLRGFQPGELSNQIPGSPQDHTQVPTGTTPKLKPKGRSPTRKTLPTKQVAKKPAKHQARPSKVPTRRREDREERATQLKEGARERQNPDLASWLNRVEPGSLEGLQQELSSASDIKDRSEDNMDSSSTSRGDGSTIQKGRKSGSIKVTLEKLRLRGVVKKAQPDHRLQYLNSILVADLPSLPLKDIEGLRSVAAKFVHQIDEHPDDSCYVYLDDFSYDFDKGKSLINYPTINRRYFDADLNRCMARNEAVLQRTIMIHIINQFWLNPIFDWNTEGQWSQPKDTRLPSRVDDEISLPKPDLAISFTLESFTAAEDDSDPFPEDLRNCLSPDGGNRCFPFLFFEVKAGGDLQDAYTANLHSASQALYNMHRWMVRCDKEKLFLDEIRVFSVVFNALHLGIRVHRAVKLPSRGGELSFQFDEFRPSDKYSKDQACLLIKTILDDYAAKELHSILKSTFAEIVRQEDERVMSKRKVAPSGASSSKRPRRNGNALLNAGQSFGISNLST